MKFEEKKGYKWETAFLELHAVLRPHGKSAVFLFIYILRAFKAILNAGKIVKKCLQLLAYRMFGYDDNRSSSNKQRTDEIVKTRG